jgi:hypothetical protein
MFVCCARLALLKLRFLVTTPLLVDIVQSILHRLLGMMDTAYFVGRGELLDFFNTLLGTRLTKIEQTASGAIACQLTEYIFPGSIPMSRVNWEAK